MASAGFEPVFCMAADPQSKGRIERTIRFVKDNFLKDELNTRQKNDLLRRMRHFDFNQSAGITKSQLQQMRALFITMEGLVNNLHEKTSIIITTNKTPTEWVEILQDEVLVSGTVTRQKEV